MRRLVGVGHRVLMNPQSRLLWCTAFRACIVYKAFRVMDGMGPLLALRSLVSARLVMFAAVFTKNTLLFMVSGVVLISILVIDTSPQKPAIPFMQIPCCAVVDLQRLSRLVMGCFVQQFL